jgi:drug/metabolite transporter (DMT)-like permease
MTALARAAARALPGPLAAPDARARLHGLCCAAVMMLIWAAYPVVTRLAVTQTLAPQDLFALRFGISGLVLAPYLARLAPALPRGAWVQGLGLALCQGLVAALLIGGLALAPASHAAALVQGAMPAWVLVVGALCLGRRPPRLAARAIGLIAAGVVALVAGAALDARVLRGDGLFLLASLLAGGYVLQARRYRLPPTAAAAFVAVYTAVGFLPGYLLSGTAGLAGVTAGELAFQALYQGVLVGVVSFIALNRAIALLGGTTASAFVAAVPVLTALIAAPALGEWPSFLDCGALLLIALGVGCAARASREDRVAPRPEQA